MYNLLQGVAACSQFCQELSSVEGFDPETGCWEVLPSMNSKRANAGIVASGGNSSQLT